ncbi:MAG: SCP2 domain-containing protein [Candidatus Rariloculaceae bacterium]
MNSFPHALIEQVLNGHIRESTAAMERLESLAGRSLAIEFTGPGIALILTAAERELRVEAESEAEATATLSGTPLALLASLRGDSLSGFRAAGISLHGDAEVAEAYSELLRLARPDLEEQLSHVTGDFIAHQAGVFVRDISSWGARAIEASRMNLSEYLQEESRHLPARAEVENFYADVDALRDAADRVAARVEQQLSDNGGRE